MFKIGYKEHSRALNLLISGARILGSGKTRQEQNAVWFDIKRSSLEAQVVKNPPAIRRPWVDSSVEKICWRRDRLPAPVFLGFSHGSAGKESACDAGDLGSIPGSGKSPGEGDGDPVFFPRESHGQRSLACNGVTRVQESDTISD